MKAKIFIVDDHVMLREGLKILIDEMDECEVTGTCSDGLEFLTEIEKGNIPDLVLLDLNMPGMDGYETSAWLKKNRPGIKILVYTMYGAAVPTIRMLQHGVKGIIRKDEHPDEIQKAVRLLLGGQYYFGKDSNGHIASFFSERDNASVGGGRPVLTEMEINFMKFSATDKPYKEIAADLGVTVRTLENLRKGLFDKLDIKSKTGLAIYALRNGIVSL